MRFTGKKVISLVFILVVTLIYIKNHERIRNTVYYKAQLPIHSQNDVNNETSQPPVRSCLLTKRDRHLCWIGESMLSRDGEFYHALHKKASPDKVIILAPLDSAFLDMAMNYYESLKHFSIHNFLFICSDGPSVKMLAANKIDCFLYPQEALNEKPSKYGSKDFKIKQRKKIKIVAAALMLGFTTVLSDIDIVFLKVPTTRFNIDADISFTMDGAGGVNTGLYVARPTAPSIKLLLAALEVVMTRMIDDQDAMNLVLGKKTISRNLTRKMLPMNEFCTGEAYWNKGKRMFVFDRPCSNGSCDVIAVHNNFIATKAAKIYRFKENGMWLVDKNGYYSNPYRRYLQYSNPSDFGNKTLEREKSALMSALTISKLLNRTLILPKFHCPGCGKTKPCTLHCAFHIHFHVQTFDQYFENQYREHVFLAHPLVPNKIKTSVANMTTIDTANSDKVSSENIIQWFGAEHFSHFSVLQFPSLYVHVTDDDKAWGIILGKALKKSNQLQLEPPR